MLVPTGARTDIRNNAKQTPYDLARNPDVGMLLRGAVGWYSLLLSNTTYSTCCHLYHAIRLVLQDIQINFITWTIDVHVEPF